MNKVFLPYPEGRILTFLGVTKDHILFCPEEKKKSLRCIINHANCLQQQCQENDHSYINHQYSWHLSKSSGHAYPSAFREVSMCKHSFTIFRVMLKLFITCLSVHPICHIILMYQCLLLVILLLHCVFRALGYTMCLKLSNTKEAVESYSRPEFSSRNYFAQSPFMLNGNWRCLGFLCLLQVSLQSNFWQMNSDF